MYNENNNIVYEIEIHHWIVFKCWLKYQLQRCFILLNRNGHCCNEANAKNRIKITYTVSEILLFEILDISSNFMKRPKNLQDCLMHSVLNKPNESSQSTKCNRRRCTNYSSIIEKLILQVYTNTDETFNLHFSGNCTSKDVIYLITRKKCKMQYIGQTYQLLSKSMKSHKFNINIEIWVIQVFQQMMQFTSILMTIQWNIFLLCQLIMFLIIWTDCSKRRIWFTN